MIPAKSAVESGWKTIPATSRWRRPSSDSSATWAVVMANSRSGAGALSLREPPKIESRKPTEAVEAR
jgi:hypothetical protein